MKKLILTILLCSVMILGITGCGGVKDSSNQGISGSNDLNANEQNQGTSGLKPAEPPARVEAVIPDDLPETVIIGGKERETSKTKLSLGDSYIKDEDLKNIDKMLHLETLYLYRNDITDISKLEGLLNLRILSLYNNKIKDFSPIRNLTNLESLNISGNPVENFSFLENLGNLKSLDLEHTGITKLPDFSKLPKLSTLVLRNNPISDISSLYVLKDTAPDIYEIYLTNTNVSKNDIEKLQKLLPKCHIYY